MTQLPLSKILLLWVINQYSNIGSNELFYQYRQIPEVLRKSLELPLDPNNQYADLHILGKLNYVKLDNRRIQITDQGRNYITAFRSILEYLLQPQESEGKKTDSQIKSSSSESKRNNPIENITDQRLDETTTEQITDCLDELESIWNWVNTEEERENFGKEIIKKWQSKHFRTNEEQIQLYWAKLFGGLGGIGLEDKAHFLECIRKSNKLLNSYLNFE